MGLEVLGAPQRYVAAVVDVLTSPTESARRRAARRRTCLYRDDYQWILREHITSIFNEPAVRQRLIQLIPLVGGTSFLKRIADELARPIYARAPMRRIVMPDEPFGQDYELPGVASSEVGKPGPDEDADQALGRKEPALSPQQQAWNDLARAIDLDGKMDLIARLLVAANHVFALVRYVPKRTAPGDPQSPDAGGRMCLDILTPDMVTVLQDQDDPTKALAITYDVATDVYGRPTKSVVWDDKRTFILDGDGRVIGGEQEHGFGRIPIVEIHRRSQWGRYWDDTTGSDLEATTLAGMMLDLIAMKKVKTQSHIQLAYVGDADGLVKDQVSDEESILVVTGGKGQIFPIDLQSDPSKIAALREMLEVSCAANHGINRERLNQQGGKDVGEDVALRERVAELARVLVAAEAEVFELVKLIAREDARFIGKIPDQAKLFIDLGQLHNRVDRVTQLAVRQSERSMGLRSGIDDVLEDNPEFGNDRYLAMQYVREKMREEAIIVEERRKLNIPADAVTEAPGSKPKFNGALGPAVRDGVISKDQAASLSQSGQAANAGVEASSKVTAGIPEQGAF